MEDYPSTGDVTTDELFYPLTADVTTDELFYQSTGGVTTDELFQTVETEQSTEIALELKESTELEQSTEIPLELENLTYEEISNILNLQDLQELEEMTNSEIEALPLKKLIQLRKIILDNNTAVATQTYKQRLVRSTAFDIEKDKAQQQLINVQTSPLNIRSPTGANRKPIVKKTEPPITTENRELIGGSDPPQNIGMVLDFSFVVDERENLEIEQKRIQSQLKIIGVVGMICSRIEIEDIIKLHLHLRNSYYHSTWRSLHVTLSNPKCAIVIYQRKGNIVSLGTKSEEEMQLSLKKITIILSRILGVKVSYYTPLVLNVIQSTTIEYKLNMQNIQRDKDIISNFKTLPVEKLSTFPGIDFTDEKTGIIVTVFESGAVIFKVKRGYTLSTISKFSIPSTTQDEIQEKYNTISKNMEKDYQKQLEIETVPTERNRLEIKNKKDIIELEKKFDIEIEEARKKDEKIQREKQQSQKYLVESEINLNTSKLEIVPQAFTMKNISSRIIQTFKKIIPILRQKYVRE